MFWYIMMEGTRCSHLSKQSQHLLVPSEKGEISKHLTSTYRSTINSFLSLIMRQTQKIDTNKCNLYANLTQKLALNRWISVSAIILTTHSLCYSQSPVICQYRSMLIAKTSATYKSCSNCLKKRQQNCYLPVEVKQNQLTFFSTSLKTS